MQPLDNFAEVETDGGKFIHINLDQIVLVERNRVRFLTGRGLELTESSIEALKAHLKATRVV